MPKYEILTDLNEIAERLCRASVIAFDIETAPDDEYRDDPKASLDPHRGHIVGVSFSVATETAFHVPLRHKTGPNCDSEEFFDLFRRFLESTVITKVAHNLAFEASFAAALGIVIQPPVYDTICAAQLSNKNVVEFRGLGDSGLKRLAKELLNEELPTFSTVTDGRYFDELPSDDKETVRYACADSDFTLRLYYAFSEWFKTFLPKHGDICRELESPMAVYLGIMHYNGVPLDLQAMKEKREEVKQELARLKAEIEEITGPEVDVGSSCNNASFKNYLFKTEGLPSMKETALGKPCLDDETLILLSEWCAGNRPELTELFSLVQQYRKYGKLLSTYVDGYLKYVNEATGRIHPNFYQLSTETGRLCCKNPNAQNLPRKTSDPVGARNFIKAPEGWVILSLDYSQIELRIGADYCRDENMIKTYQTGGDIHAMTTSVIYGMTYEQALDKNFPDYKEHRTIAKNVNFGTFYGIYPKSLQNTLRFKAGVDKSFEECSRILDNIKTGYPGLTRWQEETKLNASRCKYSETQFGRRRYLPGIDSQDWGEKSFAERCALNTPIQGTAADILKLACARMLPGLMKRPWLQPILQIHDELCFLCPEKWVDYAVEFIREVMEQEPYEGIAVPLVAEASVGRSFGNMKDLED